MQIKVKSLQGDEYIVDVQNGQLVSDLKACISERANGLAVDRLKLVHKGRTMQDKTLLGDYNLEEGSKIHLILQKEALASLSAAAAAAAGLGPDPSTSSPSLSSPSLGISTTTNSPILSSCQPMDTMDTLTSSRFQDDPNEMTTNTTTTTKAAAISRHNSQSQSMFEVILKERLAQHFPPATVEKIMANLQHEINADINSSSLDDLERLAKQKLNISNE